MPPTAAAANRPERFRRFSRRRRPDFPAVASSALAQARGLWRRLKSPARAAVRFHARDAAGNSLLELGVRNTFSQDIENTFLLGTQVFVPPANPPFGSGMARKAAERFGRFRACGLSPGTCIRETRATGAGGRRTAVEGRGGGTGQPGSSALVGGAKKRPPPKGPGREGRACNLQASRSLRNSRPVSGSVYTMSQEPAAVKS